MHEVQREIEKNPQTLKIVKDKLKGDKKPAKAKKNQFNSFELQGNIDVDALEKAMLAKN
jgi:hypothetical protein